MATVHWGAIVIDGSVCLFVQAEVDVIWKADLVGECKNANERKNVPAAAAAAAMMISNYVEVISVLLAARAGTRL
jgi:hypothetical protein